MELNAEFYEMIFNTIPNPIIIYDLQKKEIVKVNKEALSKTQIAEDSILGLPLGFFSSGRDGFTSDVLQEKVELTIKEGAQHFLWEMDKDDEFHQYEISLNVGKYQDKQVLVLIADDITNKSY